VGTFLLKRTEDLLQLGVCPEKLQNIRIISFTLVASCVVAFPAMIRSFANVREWSGGHPSPREIPARWF
jgi:hypothetical protein